MLTMLLTMLLLMLTMLLLMLTMLLLMVGWLTSTSLLLLVLMMVGLGSPMREAFSSWPLPFRRQG